MELAGSRRRRYSLPQRDRPLRGRTAPRHRHSGGGGHAGRGRRRRRGAVCRDRRFLGPDGEREDRRRLRHLVPAPLGDRGPRRYACLCWRAPGRRRDDGYAFGRSAAPALRRTRGGNTTRLHRPALDAATRHGAPSERSTTSGAGTGTTVAEASAGPRAGPRRRSPAGAGAPRRPSVGARAARRPAAGAGAPRRATARSRPAVLARASSRVCATTSTEDRTIAGTGPARLPTARPDPATCACTRPCPL